MHRKLLLLSAVVFALVACGVGTKCFSSTIGEADGHRAEKEYLQAEAIYKQIISESNDTDYTLGAQERLTILYIETNDRMKADAAFGELVTKYADHPRIAKTVYYVADEYGDAKKYDKAREAYQYIVDHWPQAGCAIEAQEAAIQLSIRLKNEAAAQQGYDDLITKFAGNEQLAKAVDHVADEYRRADKYEKARELYQYIVQRWPEAEHAMESQRGVVLSSIRMGDDANAASELEKLISDFGENENIARAVCEVADEYRELGRYDEALANYGYVVQTWPETEHAMEAQSGEVLTNISLKDDSAADAALNVLISKYSKSEDIEEIVKEIADEYRGLDKNAKAIDAYEKVVENWPESDEAIESQTYVAKLYISASDDANAQAAVDKLVTGFAKEGKVVEAVEEVAKEYGNASKHDKAGELYRRIVETWPDRDEAIWAQMGVVTSRLRAWDLDGAEAELGNLLSQFSGDEKLAAVVHEIVEEYRNTGAYEEGRGLFAYLLENSSQDELTMLELQVGIALQSIKLGELDKADAAVEKLIADFNDNPSLAKGLFQIAEEYYNEILASKERPLDKVYYENPVKIWERVIKISPDFFYKQPGLYHFITDCYRQLGDYEKATEYYNKLVANWPSYDYKYGDRLFIVGDKYCGAYAIWHTLQYYGLGRPIDIIVKEMQIKGRRSTSVYEIVRTFETYGISARVVKVSLDATNAVDTPFIQYLAPKGNEKLGHFVLCVPAGPGKAVILDGKKEPRVVDLSSFTDENYDETGWDGTSILIDRIKVKDLGDLISQRQEWKLLVAIASRWLESDADNLDELVACDIALSLDEQQSLLGGCTDYDCVEIGQNCLTNPICWTVWDCPMAYVCQDMYQEEMCLLSESGWLPCTYDPSHWCAPKKQMEGLCDVPGQRCGVWPANYGPCDATTGPPTLWMYQCHDWW